MDCINCGAPLTEGINMCAYCGTLNDSKGKEGMTSVVKISDRPCPRCSINMDTISIPADIPIYIERCRECNGLFFDPLELEELVSISTKEDKKVSDADKAVGSIIMGEGKGEKSTANYVKCPDCKELMKRKNYASHSGVVIDTCDKHGIWLDGGELNKIIRWTRVQGMKKTGGHSGRHDSYKDKKYSDSFDTRRVTDVIFSKKKPKSKSIFSDALGIVALLAVDVIKDALD